LGNICPLSIVMQCRAPGVLATAFANFNSISHLPCRVPFADLLRAKVRLPMRQKSHGCRAAKYPCDDGEERL
jgi:hypothetical protein